MKTIGILGGLGPESTLLYYSYITKKYHETYGDFAYPEIIIYSLKFSEYIDRGYETPQKIRTAIGKLHSAGADFVIAACNSIHIVYDEVCRDIPIPWISIVDAAGEQIQKTGMKKVGLLGTVFTMTNDFYPKSLAKLGIETITPDRETQKKLNDIIYSELVTDKIIDSSKQFILECIEELHRNRAQGVVLGCTELPMAVHQEDTAVPVFDTTVIHAQKALDLAMEG